MVSSATGFGQYPHMQDVLILGPQFRAPNLRDALGRAGIEGPLAAVTAGAGWRVVTLAGLAVAVNWAVRFAAALRFRQSWLGAWLHPVGVLLVLCIQWYALWQRIVGRDVAWKGRVQHEA